VNSVVKEEFVRVADENIKENAQLYEKISNVESEVADLKDERKALSNLKQKVHWATDANAKLDVVVEEASGLWKFTQRFIDEHGSDRISLLKNPEAPLREKM